MINCHSLEFVRQRLQESILDNAVLLLMQPGGDLKRQTDTSQLVLASQPTSFSINVDSRFNEIRNDEQIEYLLPELVKVRPDIASLVERGLTSSKDYQKAIDAVFNFWVSEGYKHPEIQSWHDYSMGVRDALTDVIKNQGSGKTIAIFTSGGTIATIVAQVLGLSGKQTYPFYEPMFNCAVTQLFYNQERISLSYFNDRSFLQVLAASIMKNWLPTARRWIYFWFVMGLHLQLGSNIQTRTEFARS